jgi:serine/threonine-protein kinase
VRLGPYRLIEEVDPRGVTATWRAIHDELGRPALVRALRPAASHSSAFARELEREAAALARLDHEGFARLYDFERETSGPWLALEDPGGFALPAVIAKAGRVEPACAVAIALALARALGHAHARGIVHRAVAPRAITLTPAGRVLLGDLGSSHVEGATAAAGEAPEALGRPDHMAPEQILGEPAAPPADVFSLGVVLHELVAGSSPFASGAAESVDVARRIRSASPTPLRDLVPGVPRSLDRLVLRCLAKRAEERYADGALLAAALEDVLAELTSSEPAALVVRALGLARLVEDAARPQVEPATPRPASLLRGLAREAQVLALVGSALVVAVLAIDLLAGAPHAPPSKAEPRAAAGPRGFVRVLARPWADVVVDGELVDTTPIGRPLPVVPGRHYVTFRHPAAPDEQRTVDVAAGQTVLLDVTLRVARAARPRDAGAAPPAASDSP